MDEIKEVGGAIWREDDRDYMVEDIFGAENYSNPENFRLDIDEHNQNAQKETYYACTAYATYHAGEILFKFLNVLNSRSVPLEGFRKQKTYGTFKENVGDYVDTALKSVKDNGLILENGLRFEIEGYAMVARGWDANVEKMKYYISQGYGLVTSFNIREGQTYKTKGYLFPNDGKLLGGHMVVIVGYEQTPTGLEFIISNSYGEKYGKFNDGTFRIKAEHIHMLGGMYILYPKQNVNMIFKDYSEKALFAEEVQLMKDLGVVKGTDDGKLEPNRPLTRLEGILMMARLYKALKK